MKIFQQTRTRIAIRSGEEYYNDAASNFHTDYGQGIPALPEGVTERIYEPGKRHALVDAEHNVIATMDDDCPRECAWADEVIASIFTLQKHKIQREADVKIAEIAAREERADGAAS